MSREGATQGPCQLEPPKRSPRPPLLPTVSHLIFLPGLSAVCRSAATASPPVRAADANSTACQGRAGGGGEKWGRACLGLDTLCYTWAAARRQRRKKGVQGLDFGLYIITAVLGYSRMRFVTFVKRCDTTTMLRCMIDAFDYFGGLPKAALTDRMKSVFLEEMDGEQPKWTPLFSDFMATLGVAPRVCKPYKPQTKGKVERTVEVIKNGFWAGVHFTDLDDLNEQALAWCNRLNQKVHRTTRRIPMDLWVEENLRPLPQDRAFERYGAEERRVSSDGFIAFDGVLYGLPSHPPVAGAMVQVRKRGRELRVFSGGKLIATHQVRACSQEIVVHPQQFAGVSPTPSLRAALRPVGHQIERNATVLVRPLAEYDHLFGLEVVP